jgi:hypothetical protein
MNTQHTHTHAPPQGLLPLLSCAALVNSRKCNGTGTEQSQAWENLQASGAPAIQGRLYVRQDTTVRTGLPFHIDGPFFISDGGRGGLKVSLTVLRATVHICMCIAACACCRNAS